MKINLDLVSLAALAAAGYVAWRWYTGGNTTQQAAVDAFGHSSLATPFTWWTGQLHDWTTPEAAPADAKADQTAQRVLDYYDMGGLSSL